MGQARRILVALLFACLACAQSRLSVERIALHQFEDGPILAATYEFVPGETANFSCRLTGFKIVQTDEQRSVKLAWQMRVLDPSGVPIEKDQSGRIEDKLCAAG